MIFIDLKMALRKRLKALENLVIDERDVVPLTDENNVKYALQLIDAAVLSIRIREEELSIKERQAELDTAKRKLEELQNDRNGGVFGRD